MELPPKGCGLTGAKGSGVVVTPEEEDADDEELSAPPEGTTSASKPLTAPKTFAAVFTTAAVLVPTKFVRGRVRGCTAVPASAIPEEEE